MYLLILATVKPFAQLNKKACRHLLKGPVCVISMYYLWIPYMLTTDQSQVLGHLGINFLLTADLLMRCIKNGRNTCNAHTCIFFILL